MVMEHKPAVVVMLTNVEENGKVWMVFMSLQLTNRNEELWPHRMACMAEAPRRA